MFVLYVRILAFQVILMDHPLRSISYVADIGRLVVVMARRRFPQQEGVTGPDRKSKLLCHVLESDDVSRIDGCFDLMTLPHSHLVMFTAAGLSASGNVARVSS